ncbi:MAG TPA: GTP 3',8-cyclase MoaA [Persephonella sp.]|uniref:Molybdenum cofactor biosynthesis protein A n=1 Tax=Persephonella marina (strain DSM 14350 / EX-H1) TaxID=123214 RepID=C0QPH2_PERMH|nr:MULTISPECIES: GTP 3',8-cyclase MoaA [Persephonella]ACO03780.1 molybdenum cofactor biosynthesis protein A [Persephonella marina EX-H1]HCB69818.1 GTP 3',8-cyclase MoaA [Persephonella sp.]
MNISYLRVSVTDKCNLKCFYCRPDNSEFVPHDEILRYEEIARLVKAMTKYGLRKVRITGGEPLVRPQLEELVKMLKDIPQINDISLTTNAITLSKHAEKLRKAGLDRLNISIDSLKPELFYQITKGRLEDVLEGIRVSKELGYDPIKVNAVIVKGLNEDEALDFVEFGKEYGVEVRFIEMMPIGGEQIQWSEDKVQPLKEIKDKIEKKYGKLIPAISVGSGAARVYKIPKLGTKIGFITPISNPFCDGCSKLRLTAEGHIKLCLRTDDELDAKEVVRYGTDEELDRFIKKVLIEKDISNQKIMRSGYAFSDCRRIMTSIGG